MRDREMRLTLRAEPPKKIELNEMLKIVDRVRGTTKYYRVIHISGDGLLDLLPVPLPPCFEEAKELTRGEDRVLR